MALTIGRLRSRAFPRGFDPREPRTRLGNELLLVTLIVLTIVRRSPGVAGSWAYPRQSLSWLVPQVVKFMSHAACSSLWFSLCSYGCALRRDVQFGAVHAQFLAPLARPCAGFHRHDRGSLPAQASSARDVVDATGTDVRAVAARCAGDSSGQRRALLEVGQDGEDIPGEKAGLPPQCFRSLAHGVR